MLIRPWNQRSQETAYLFNPPFCCAVLTSAIGGYLQEDERGMPFPLAYIVLPVILHKKTRENLATSTRTPLAAWMEEHPEVKVQFYERAVAMKSFVGEGILFGIHNNWLTLDKGNLKTSLKSSKIQNIINKSEGEAKVCVLKARLIGKWFALAGSPETIMALWEVRP
jgi:hypothetical protein